MKKLRLLPESIKSRKAKPELPPIEPAKKLPAPKKLAKQSRDQRQLRYLAQSIRLEESVSPRIVQRTMLIISLAVILFVAWASVTTVDEIAHAEGEIIARGMNAQIMHPDGGRVAELFKKEGDTVQVGDPILRLSETTLTAEIKNVRARHLDLALSQVRLAALHDEVPPDFSAFQEQHADALLEEMALYDAYNAQRQQERQLITEQIRQREQNLTIQQGQLKVVKQNMAIAKDIYGKRLKLRDDGVVPESRYLEIKQRLNELEGEVRTITNQISLTQLTIQEQRTRLEALNARYRDELLREMDKAALELEELEAQLERLDKQFERLTITAPVSGTIKGSTIHGADSVIQPGALVMEIVPSDSELIALIKIPAQHIGHVHVGDPVRLKFATFDYARYGGLTGTLEYISASSFFDQNSNTTYFQGRVTLDSLHIGDNPNYRAMAGMSLTADIIADKKTIIAYLLKPVRDSLRTAFTER